MSDESSTLTVSDLEEGKRYKVSFEGTYRDRLISTGSGAIGFADGPYGSLRFASSIEALPDPEPEWQLGTVVKAQAVYLKTLDGWAGAGGHSELAAERRAARISEAWKAGTLEILYTPKD